MKPINEHLFEALRRKFGTVGITNAGAEAQYKVINSLVSYHDSKEPKKISVLNWGETYSVNCLKCRDKRGRLYISHIWGTKCEAANNRRILSCTKCHNEGCNWSDLWDTLYSNDSQSYTVNTDSLKTGVSADSYRMELPGEVDDLIPVNQLPADHPVVEYLVSRGFSDLNLMAREYQFCYCRKSPWKKSFKDSKGCWHSITPEARLIIPNVQQGVWRGWMARFIGVAPKDPSTGKPLIQKYLNAPGYSFGASLYRLEDAVKFTDGKFCIVCEGALSAIACGFAGIGTFGMYPKPMQEELLVKHFPNGRIVFMIESESAANGRIYQCIERVQSKIKGKCIAAEMPLGQDPATLPGLELLRIIENKCKGA